MLSRLVILACSFFCLPFFFISCSDSSVTSSGTVPASDTGSFVYPFKDGTSWIYSRIYSVKNIRPDSIRHYFSEYPVHGSGTTAILYDTVINGITVKCFLSDYTENSHLWRVREYYANYDSGLVCYGYREPSGVNLTPFKVSGTIEFRWKEYKSNSLQKLCYEIENGHFHNQRFSISGDDSLYLENPPVTCLKYPVVSGTEWLFKYISVLGDIHKKYLGFEKILIGTVFYNTMKTQRIWINMTDLTYYDYYSKFGILKRDYTIKDVMVMNELGRILGYVDFNDLYNVNTLNIP